MSFVPDVLAPAASAAVWEVTDTDPWAAHNGAVVEGVEPHYLPWDEDDAWWSPSLSLHLSSGTFTFLLARTSPDGVLEPSADDVTVLFSADHLPAWLS